MKLPLELALRDISPSMAVERHIRDSASKLDRFSDQVMRCRVVVEAPVRHHRKGGPFTVRIDLTVPGDRLVVNRQKAHDLYIAISQAFTAARRQLQDYVRRQRGAVKTHEPISHARVRMLFPNEGYGFLQTPDGREIYFHRNSVLDAAFDRLVIGTAVRFAEEQGEQGPQASTVAIVGKHREGATPDDQKMGKRRYQAIYPLVVLILLFPTLVLAEITEVRIGVDGMMTAHEVAEAQKSLSRMRGVHRVEVRTEQAQAIITPEAGFRLEIPKLREALINAGLTPSWIRFKAVGLLTSQNGSPGFKVQGTGQVITLDSERKLQELMAATRRDCDLLTLVGIIPPGKETARLEHFEVWGFSGSRC